MNGQLPTSVRARMLSTLHGEGSPVAVPGEFSAELRFENGVTASFYNSFVTQNQQWIHFSGEAGYLQISDFVLPYHGAEVAATVGNDHFMINNCDFHMENHLRRYAVREASSAMPDAQEVRLVREFSRLVLSGQTDAQWPQWTLSTQRVLDACWQSAAHDGAEIELS